MTSTWFHFINFIYAAPVAARARLLLPVGGRGRRLD